MMFFLVFIGNLCFVLCTLSQIKQESSGWPAWCVEETTKQRYMENYYAKEGVLLDYANISKNPGLRSLAKLMLNRYLSFSISNRGKF